ncbi:MAG: hypothetical protein LVR00_07700 [Rhabdochlamydiaceae bacterium]|jgi:predicted HTH transcriptional regulator
MDENVPNNDAKQGVLRFRSLVNRSSEQTFTFALTGSFHQMLKREKIAIDAKDVARYLRLREKEEEANNALLLFRKELEAHLKQAASHIEHQIFSNQDLSHPDIRAAYLNFLRKEMKSPHWWNELSQPWKGSMVALCAL